MQIGTTLVQLRTLDLQACPAVTLQAVRNLDSVRVLILNGCDGLMGGVHVRRGGGGEGHTGGGEGVPHTYAGFSHTCSTQSIPAYA